LLSHCWTSAALAVTLDLIELAVCYVEEMLSRVARRLVLKPARMAYIMTSVTAGPLRYAFTVRPLTGPAPYELDFLESPKLPPQFWRQPTLPARNRWLLDSGKHYSLGPGRGSQPREEDWLRTGEAAARLHTTLLAHALQARALPARPPGLAAPPARGSARHAWRKRPTAESPTFEAVIIDSGCTWHAYPRREDLIHTRPCDDNISTADGADHRT
jgi:hypothetical protein